MSYIPSVKEFDFIIVQTNENDFQLISYLDIIPYLDGTPVPEEPTSDIPSDLVSQTQVQGHIVLVKLDINTLNLILSNGWNKFYSQFLNFINNPGPKPKKLESLLFRDFSKFIDSRRQYPVKCRMKRAIVTPKDYLSDNESDSENDNGSDSENDNEDESDDSEDKPDGYDNDSDNDLPQDIVINDPEAGTLTVIFDNRSGSPTTELFDQELRKVIRNQLITTHKRVYPSKIQAQQVYQVYNYFNPDCTDPALYSSPQEDYLPWPDASRTEHICTDFENSIYGKNPEPYFFNGPIVTSYYEALELYKTTIPKIDISYDDKFISTRELDSDSNILLSYFVGPWYDELDLTNCALTGSCLPAMLVNCVGLGDDRVRRDEKCSIELAKSEIDILYPCVYTELTGDDQKPSNKSDLINVGLVKVDNNILTAELVYAKGKPKTLDFEIKKGADVDIIVKPEVNLKEEVEKHFELISKYVKSAKLSEITESKYRIEVTDPNESLKYRSVDIYQSYSLFTVLTHHVAPVRGFVTGNKKERKLVYGATFECSYLSRDINEYFLFRSKKSRPQDIILKYMTRGFLPEPRDKLGKTIYSYISDMGYKISNSPFRFGVGCNYNILNAVKEYDERRKEIVDKFNVKMELWDKMVKRYGGIYEDDREIGENDEEE